MGNYSEAVRAMREAEAECPNCHVKNERGAHVIKIDMHQCAYCSVCGFEWDIDLTELRKLKELRE